MKHNTDDRIQAEQHPCRPDDDLTARSNRDGIWGLMIGIACAARNASAEIVSGHSIAFCKGCPLFEEYNDRNH
jgi:hypothetical protein